MLTLWLAHSEIAGIPVSSDIELETLGEGGLVPVESVAGLTTPAKTWWIPPGLALNPGLLVGAVATGCKVLVTINGLGERVLAEVVQQGGDQVILFFDADGIDTLNLAEQLAWLKEFGRPFAVGLTDASQAIPSVLAGAEALVALRNSAEVAAMVSRIRAASRPGAPRPISAQEVDCVDGAEVCLTVSRPMQAGMVVSSADLTVARTETRGLSPILAARVSGLCLAYDIVPGEPLHFAHFRDPKA